MVDMKSLMLMIFLIFGQLLIAPCASLLAADTDNVDVKRDGEINEEELFSGEETVVESSNQERSVDETVNRRGVSVSGELTSAFSYSSSRVDQFSQSSTAVRSSLKPSLVGDVYVDARLKDGYKGFGSFELKHDAWVDEQRGGEKETTFSTKELFADLNFNRNLYLRAGKQVLSWGQCYLWNPTDMINVENKSFLHKLEAREGTYGVKGHIPFGTAVNIYGFASMEQVDEGEDVAGAGKFEFLINGTEMALSAWGKRNFNPVYGYDISSRLLGIDIKGEVSYSHGGNREKLINDNGLLTSQIDDNRDICRASINLARDFDFGEKADRLNISAEFFYNGDGYSDNPLEDSTLYQYDDKLFKIDGTEVTIPVGDMKTYLLGHNLYEANYFSRYYAALFITLREFIVSDITLTLNGISNIEQDSYILSSNLSYTSIRDLTAGLSINRYLGDKDGEYRAGGMQYDVLITAGILF